MKDRLKILFENNVIDKDVYEKCINLHEGYMSENNLVSYNAYTVFMTHVAMALNRIKSNNIVGELDDFILNEIKSDEEFNFVKNETSKIKALLNSDIPDSEMQYFWLHYLNILRERRESND
ncbi:MAG: PRD domain-containing protein [Erysipelotrichaceae bacterium]|nr:PRD domain-containing protein [Erysipelotrichaceae bacterium]